VFRSHPTIGDDEVAPENGHWVEMPNEGVPGWSLAAKVDRCGNAGYDVGDEGSKAQSEEGDPFRELDRLGLVGELNEGCGNGETCVLRKGHRCSLSRAIQGKERVEESRLERSQRHEASNL
jgi:hypothetical protein